VALEIGLPAALSSGDVILIAVFVAIPIAAITFIIGAGAAYGEVGKGALSLEFESDLPQRPSDDEAASARAREEEIRQLVEAKAYRQRARGETPVEVEAEVARLLEEHRRAAAANVDAGLREEVRQLVVARNDRRRRQGKGPLDIEAEVERQLRELENLGQ
jgi:hypothetical protein